MDDDGSIRILEVDKKEAGEEIFGRFFWQDENDVNN